MTILATGIAVGIQSPRGASESISIVFDNISNADLMVGDALNVSDWNTFFDLPTYGIPFTSVIVTGNTIELLGGNTITLREGLFGDNTPTDTCLLEVIDTGCIIALDNAGYQFSNSNGNGCLGLVNIELPACNILGIESFAGCETLETIVLDFNNITNIPDYCFMECQILITTMILPLATVVGYSAFGYCRAIQSIELPEVITLSPYCFDKCYLLTTVILPNTLIELPEGCFQDCQALISFSHASLQELGTGTFYRCIALGTINTPNVTILGESVMNGCVNLETVSLNSCVALGPTVGDNEIFNNIVGQNITLTIPSALMTCNAGNPDGDIQYLVANNTVNIIQV